MALSKDQKNQVVTEVGELLGASKLTVVARYPGTSVKAMQQLRRDARANGTTVKVVKNRLFKKALESSETFKDLSTSDIQGQLLYAFNPQDEVAPAQDLAAFAKTQPQIEFVGAITADGQFMSAQDVQELANLPSKEQLRGMLVGTLAAPLTGFVGVMSGNVRGILNVLNARSEQLS